MESVVGTANSVTTPAVVILANLSEVKRRLRLSQLLPLPFDARLLS